jgi:uncharacterized protein (TIGR02466 family)
MRHLFSTLIDEMTLGDGPLRSSLERAAWILSEDDTAGNDWCEQEGYPGYTSYASLDDLPERFPEFGALKKLLDKAAAKFAAALHWPDWRWSSTRCGLTCSARAGTIPGISILAR